MHRSLAVLTLALVGLVAACTGPGTTPAPVTPPAATPTVAPVVTPSAVAGPTVSLSSSGNLVGPNGLSLYVFDKDAADTSNCSGQCATNWPALTVSSATGITVGTGLTATDFATITRSDNSALQVTSSHLPLYFFAGDSAPGDMNGDGVGGIWHLAKPGMAPATSGPSTAPGSPAAVCKDEYDVVYPCPSASAEASTVSISSAGYLVGADGMTLYTFDNDDENKSNCSGDCASNWPALIVDSEDSIDVGAGLDDDDFATAARSDGSLQVSYYGEPLYTFAGDQAAGDTNGDGVGGVWHLAMPE